MIEIQNTSSIDEYCSFLGLSASKELLQQYTPSQQIYTEYSYAKIPIVTTASPLEISFAERGLKPYDYDPSYSKKRYPSWNGRHLNLCCTASHFWKSNKRCAIVVDSIVYEWYNRDKTLDFRYRLIRKDRLPFLLAGAYETSDSQLTFTMFYKDTITDFDFTSLMPILLAKEDLPLWLNKNQFLPDISVTYWTTDEFVQQKWDGKEWITMTEKKYVQPR